MPCLARLLGVLLVVVLPALAAAQQPAPTAQQVAPTAQTAAPQQQTPDQVRQFLRLLDDPSVRAWLDAQRTQAAATTAPAAAAPASAAPEEATFAARLSQRMDELESHLAMVLAALPKLPGEAESAYKLLRQELKDVGLIKVTVLLAVFSLLGFGLEQVFWRVTARLRGGAAELPEATLRYRLRSIATRLAIGLASVAVFGLGSIGAFLAFSWPPLLREIVLGYLLAFLAVRFVLEIGRVLLMPHPRESEDPARHRVIPATTPAAQFWHRRIGIVAAYFAIAWATLQLLVPLGVAPEARIALGHLLGMGLLGLGLEILWRRPRPEGDVSAQYARHRTAWNAILTVYIVLLGGLWLIGANGLLALGFVILLLPIALSIVQSAVRNLLRPEEPTSAGEGTAPTEAPAHNDEVLGVFLERGLRVFLVVAAVLFLAHAWNVDLVEMTTGGDTPATRILRAALSIIVILLLAELIWELLRAWIDRRVSQVPLGGPDVQIRHARLRTLLPIFRNIALVLIAGTAVLMTLSQLGVEIGPLIAGAGVVGVAVGFGAQTVVKDIISGIFYLLDDAFRVGEYIQSGSYTGTVEGFSLRSVKLRAPRGPIFTVPFGQLGAVENLSRDWAIDKFQIGITYDSDLDKARKLIKKIGEDMKADPELGPSIIEPLKMQGVQEFGTFAIQIRLKITTRPGEQTTIRRKAYAMIKKAFDANGIAFAFPTVQVAGGADSANAKPAVANQVLELLQPPKQAEG